MNVPAPGTLEFFEFFAPLEGMEHSGTHVLTVASWLRAMNEPGVMRTVSAIKPPTYWLTLQDEIGRGAAKFNIWRNKYSREKQLATWASAPIEDFIAAGYARRRWVSDPNVTVYQMWLAAQAAEESL